MTDTELKLVDTDDISVVESNKNLILTFNKQVTYEVGDRITVWCSELVERTYTQVAGWFKFPYREGMKPIQVPPGLDKNMPKGGLFKPKGCEVCGGRLVFIRAQYPGGKKRKVCPTCAVEILEYLHSQLTNRQAQSAI